MLPKTRTDFWRDKIDGNRRRDRDTDARMAALGLASLRIWEHVSPIEAADLVVQRYRECLSESERPAIARR